jgi:hypothetical protein
VLRGEGKSGRVFLFVMPSENARMKFSIPCVNYVVVACLLATIFPCVYAQTAPADDDVQSVQIKGVRDPAMLPYKKAYDYVAKIRDASGDRVRMVFRITSRESHAPIENLSISIQGSKTYETLDISPSGYFSIPTDSDAYEDNADFISNAKKGSLVLNAYMVPNLPKNGLKYADIVETVKGARRARAELLPWYLRMIAPTIGGIGLCYSDSAQTVAVQGANGEIRRTATNGDKRFDADVYCANFSAKETELVLQDIVAPPAGWQPIFLQSMF